ncbi:hypothetical protein BDD12DRAFT_810464 [Trichophaea hybrida]|nr:hypothetical protein BDD12DRAFT_810464 [Trichophaea hybrida]
MNQSTYSQTSRLIHEADFFATQSEHIFSAFMWSISKKVGRIDGQTTVQQTDALNPTSWEFFKLENTTLSRIAQGVQRARLGSLEESYQLLLPPLSLADKLPVDAAVNSVLHHVKGREANGNWEDATQIYMKLLEFGTSPKSSLCPFKMKAVAAVVEFSRSIALTTQIWFQQERDVEKLEKLKQNLLEKLKTSVEKDILDNLQTMYGRQHRLNELEDLISKAPLNNIEYSNPGFLGYTPLHEAVFSRQLQIADNKKYINQGDLLGWTPLRYAVVGKHQDTLWYIYQ